jgi:hypothetical protein
MYDPKIEDELHDIIMSTAEAAATEILKTARTSMSFSDAYAAAAFALAEFGKINPVAQCPEIVRDSFLQDIEGFAVLEEIISNVIEEEEFYNTDFDEVLAAFSNVQEVGDEYFESIEEDIVDITGDPNGPFAFGYIKNHNPFDYFWFYVNEIMGQEL